MCFSLHFFAMLYIGRVFGNCIGHAITRNHTQPQATTRNHTQPHAITRKHTRNNTQTHAITRKQTQPHANTRGRAESIFQSVRIQVGIWMDRGESLRGRDAIRRICFFVVGFEVDSSCVFRPDPRNNTQTHARAQILRAAITQTHGHLKR